MKIAPPESMEALIRLRDRLQRGLPAREGGYWTVMIYHCRWGWVARSQLRKGQRKPIQLELVQQS